MKTHKLIIGASVLSLIAGVAQANSVSNEIFLANATLNGVSYYASYDASGNEQTGPVVKPNQGTVSQFTISTDGTCSQQSSSTTYPIVVTAETGQNLCQFNLVVTVTNNSQNVSSTNKANVDSSSCDTSGSTASAKIEDLDQYSAGTTDYCNVTWFKVNSTSGQVLITTATH